MKWDKEEARKLLEGSEKSCLNFYLGTAGTTGQGDFGAKYVVFIKDQNDFLEGTFEDLVILNKSGMMSPFGSSLHLIERARKRLEEKALEKIDGSDIGMELRSRFDVVEKKAKTETGKGISKS